MLEYKRILLAVMYVEGLADSWYLNYVEGKENMGWDQFCEIFNKLKQETTVEEYAIQFEELKAFIQNMSQTLSEQYFIHSFVNSLKEEISQIVEMLNRTNLSQAIHLAKRQERLLDSLLKSKKINHKVSHIGSHKAWKDGIVDNNNLKKQMIHALARQLTLDTIKLLGKVGKHHLLVLVDTGSTYTFLDPSTARKLQCVVEYTNPLLVTVANGGRWNIGENLFSANDRMLKLGRYDMVIHVDLLKRLGPVTFDFDNQKIQFTR
ncbi:hypothetical protein Pfo_011550 [Paulownia fortunei]|nr:hypothetical protein Pfo_011550 [Paulownia fortunei]